ncbi:hypothetical protein QTP70_032531 [Hemibagrus guttatus]|uniref:Endonuclease/exonuclease/phosphatase domain-containing protein n=1 Tax=Hemibagrus guttatus TaxID=175788 RepID=A0AAE0Q8A7_9TELE|nr:hypothetical protein QTP70_032531 [Hemibagrus guttatus]
MTCTQAELEQQSSQTTSPGHYAPSDWFCDGLKALGVLDALQRYPLQMMCLFVKPEKALTADAGILIHEVGVMFPATSSTFPCLSQTVVVGGLSNGQSAVRKADFISALASHYSFDFLALTETWISPQNTATPTALSSAYTFSHSPRESGRGGGTGLLLSRGWCSSPLLLSHLTIFSFEFHAVSVSSPISLFIIVIYRPPGPLGDFLEEMDTLLSIFPSDNTPLMILGDCNLPSDKLHSSGSSEFILLVFQQLPSHTQGRKLHSSFSSYRHDCYPTSYLRSSPAPPSPSSLTAEDFTTFYTEKIERICQTFTSPPTSSTSHSQDSTTPSLTQLSTVAAEEVLQIIRPCNPTTCPLDPIPSAMLQTISPELLPFITTVINGSLTSGHVPTVFKKTRVIPILKKPALDPSDISNYRPVSLLSFPSKIFERVVCNQLSDYLLQNNLHDPNQSDFKAAHSTETALLVVTENLHAASQTVIGPHPPRPVCSI